MGVIARPFSLRGRMMAKAWNQTRVSEALGIEYPIIQGPLGGLSSQRLTAAVSNFGGLGSFGAHGLEPNAIEDVNRPDSFSDGKAVRPEAFLGLGGFVDDIERTPSRNGWLGVSADSVRKAHHLSELHTHGASTHNDQVF